LFHVATKLATRQLLLHVKYIVSYRIVTYPDSQLACLFDGTMAWRALVEVYGRTERESTAISSSQCSSTSAFS